ncbi:MAG TPA: hypothetical protein VGS06_32750 [Streptosporangiaceae bacterium]|nr:hypothetical protein [Streptosporangiaceae bacterium]
MTGLGVAPPARPVRALSGPGRGRPRRRGDDERLLRLRRFPGLRLAGPPVYRAPGSTLRGLESLLLYLES